MPTLFNIIKKGATIATKENIGINLVAEFIVANPTYHLNYEIVEVEVSEEVSKKTQEQELLLKDNSEKGMLEFKRLMNDAQRNDVLTGVKKIKYVRRFGWCLVRVLKDGINSGASSEGIYFSVEAIKEKRRSMIVKSLHSAILASQDEIFYAVRYDLGNVVGCEEITSEEVLNEIKKILRGL